MIQAEPLTRFVVAGCSRSGTTYMAELMSALGFQCGHERVFNIWSITGLGDLIDPMTAFFDLGEKQGDASFLSIPYIDQLPKGTIVLHQVRNPLEVIQSHMGIRFFADPYLPSMYLANEHPRILGFLQTHCQEIWETNTEIGRCMRYWYYWNRLAERAKHNPSLIYLRYRIEDINISTLRGIIRNIGGETPETKCRQALASISKLTNARPRDTSWTFDRLPSGEDKERIIELSTAFGYSVDI